MIPVNEAKARILDGITPTGIEEVELAQALGRVLATDLTAKMTQPPFAVSAMDGYALRAEDAATQPARLRVTQAIAAGERSEHPLGSGEAARIFTGAPLPQGADAIAIQENCEREGDTVLVKESLRVGRYVRPAGLDFKTGDVLLTKGTRLGVRDIGLTAAMDHARVPVHRKPRVAILATGDELRLPGQPGPAHHIVSSNGFALAAFVQAYGGEAINLGIAADRPDALQAALEKGLEADVLVTSGGASVGEHDLVRDAFLALGVELDFWKIAMRPGKPLIHGRHTHNKDRITSLLGLPGNPVSGLVCSLVFLQPLLATLQGVESEVPTNDKKSSATAKLMSELPENDQREDYLRARLTYNETGEVQATAFLKQDSSMLATLGQADGFIVRAPFAPAAKAGDNVQILPFPPGIFTY